MNPWEEDWSGSASRNPWEEDWSNQAPAPSPASTLRRVDILPPAENKVPKWAQSLPEFAQPMFAEGETKNLNEWRERVAYEMRPGASGMEPTKAITQDDIDRIAINRWEQSGRKAPKKDIGQGVAGLAGFADIATFGLSDEFAALAPFERKLMETGSFKEAGQAFGEARQDYKALQSDATQQRPFSTRAGQTAALLAPGAKGYTMGMQVAPKLVPASVAAAVAGKSVPARLARYGGRGLAMTGLGVLDYGLYNFAAEAPNQARVAGTEMPGVGDRLQFAAEEAVKPTGIIAAAAPFAASLAYRGGRGLVTAGKNTIEDTIAATRAAPRPEMMAQGVPLPELRFRGGSFTPTDVRARVDLNTPDPATGRTPRQIAIDRLLDEGFKPDEAEKAVRLLSYDGRANVNEMLFEIENNLQEIGLAVGRINRPGRKVLEEEFKARNEGMFDEIRQAIRRAVGASGDDLEDFNETMAKKAKEQSADGYAAAYGKQVSDDTWQKITGLLGDTPDGLDAARKGAELARNSARRDPAKLEAARQLDELADILGSGGAPQTKLSTVALDFLDRGLRRKVDVAVRQGDNAYAGSLLDFRNALRGSGLDAETGLNIPRTIYAQYQAASKAAEFGEKAAGKAISLRQLKQQFLQAQRAADQALEDGIGEGSGIIDESLMMGWVRGTEDLIERADNPGTLIRQLYGSERQRQKMLDMLRELPETASPGLKADATKDRKALVGSRDGKADYEYDFKLSTGERFGPGKTSVRSLFDRQRDMLESQRVTVAGSPTGQVGDAITNQVGDRQRAQKLLSFVQGIYQNPANFAARVIDQIGQPLLYQKDVNRELGELLSTRGRDKLLSVIDEIRQRQLARSGGTPPATGAPRRPPLSGPPAGGGTAAAGFGFNPFGKKATVAPVAASEPMTNQALMGEYDRLLPRMNKAVRTFQGQDFESVPGGREALLETIGKANAAGKGASDDQIIEEAWQLMRRRQQNGPNWPPPRDSLQPAGIDDYGPMLGKLVANKQFFEVDLDTAIRESLVDLDDVLAREGLRRGDDLINLDQVKRYIDNPKARDANLEGWRPDAGARPNGLGNAFRQDLGNAGAGAFGGGVMPLPSTGDPEQDMRNRLGMMVGGAAAGFGGRRVANAFAQGARSQGFSGPTPGRFRFGPTGQAFNPYSKKVQDEIIRTSGGLVDERNIDDLVSTYMDDLYGGATPQEIADTLRRQAAFDMQNGGVPLTQRDVEYVAFAELMARQLTPMRQPKGAQTMGLGGGGRRPKKDSPEAILKGVQKITAQLKATGTQAATPQQPDMRIGKGLAKAAGITDNRELGAKAARDMLAAGRSPAEIFTATNHVPMTVDGKTIMVRAAGKSPDEVTAAFWQEMAKPVSRRAEWIREQTRGIKPIGPDAVARQPLETRVQVATAMIRQKGDRLNPQALWEETDMVVIMRAPDGQPVLSKASVPTGSEPVSLMDGANFKSWDDAVEYLRTVAKLPRAEQPAWYRENFSDPLTLQTPATRFQRVGDFAQRRQNTVGATLAGATALGGTAGVLTANDAPASMRIKLDEPPQRQNRR
jgi:hypothetical protein